MHIVPFKEWGGSGRSRLVFDDSDQQLRVQLATTQAHSLSVVSGEGALDIQAQNDAIRVQSQGALKMVSATAALEMAAGKTIKLTTAGGASITIEGGNISVACPGSITVHASQ